MIRQVEIHPRKMFSAGLSMIDSFTMLDESSKEVGARFRKETILPDSVTRQGTEVKCCGPMMLLETYHKCEDTMGKTTGCNRLVAGCHPDQIDVDAKISMEDFPWHSDLPEAEPIQLPHLVSETANPVSSDLGLGKSKFAVGNLGASQTRRYDCHVSKKRGRRSSKGHSRKLPADFEPLPYSVVVGKCREAKEHDTGNLRLRVLASNYLAKYSESSATKKTKSDIVSLLLDTIHNACPVAPFIRFGKDGRWYTVSEAVAREKVGYTFRELCGNKYRSSSQAKVTMRSIQSIRKTRNHIAALRLQQPSFFIDGLAFSLPVYPSAWRHSWSELAPCSIQPTQSL